MNNWIEIEYSDFYDVPRFLAFSHHGKVYLLDCPFDDKADDYPGEYRVYEIPDCAGHDLRGIITSSGNVKKHLICTLPVKSLTFKKEPLPDLVRRLNMPTSRRFIDATVFDEALLERAKPLPLP